MGSLNKVVFFFFFNKKKKSFDLGSLLSKQRSSGELLSS